MLKRSMRKICLALVSKGNQPKKYQVSKLFFTRKIFINFKSLKVYVNLVACNYKKLSYIERRTSKN